MQLLLRAHFGVLRRKLITYLLLLAFFFGALAAAIPAYAAPTAQIGIQRISFAPGATSATVNGAVSGGQIMRYALTAMAGQTMTVRPYSNGAPVYVSIYDPRRVLMGTVASGEVWSSVLPSTGDYYFGVYPSVNAGYTNYQLTIEIVSSSQPPPPAPERIRFAPGAVSAQVTGYLPTASSKLYLLNARAGQVMTIDSWTSSGPFQYTVTSPNGTWLGSGNQGQSWSGSLPMSGDYRITLQSPYDAPGANYGLNITVVNSAPPPTPTPVPPPAQRVTFPPGATDVTLQGYVNPAVSVRYVLRALAGQTMTVSVGAYYGGATTVTVSDGRGNVYGVAQLKQPWSGQLPYTGDYYIDVQAGPGNQGDGYTLYVEIQ